MPEELPFGRLRKIREARPPWKQKPRRRNRPKVRDGTGVPGKAQRNFTDPESRPAPGGRDFIQGYNCQAVAGDRGGSRQGSGCGNDSGDAQHRGRAPGSLRRRGLLAQTVDASMPWGWTPSSLRVGLATERQSRPRPGAAYRAICRLGTGCGGSCGRNGGGNVTRCG